MKDTVIEIYNTDMTMAGVLPGFTSLSWTTCFREPGAFELYTTYTDDVRDFLRVNNFLARSDSNRVGQIKKIELSRDADGNRTAHITGKDSLCLLDQRIIYHTIMFSGDIVGFIKQIINDNVISPSSSVRQIDLFESISGSNIGINVRAQVRWSNVMNKVRELCVQAGVGIRSVRGTTGFVLEIYPQKDRTSEQSTNAQLIFSDGLENLAAWNYSQDYDLYRNFAYVAGEAVGKSVASSSTVIGERLILDDATYSLGKRTTETVGNNLKGINRYELYVDARNLQSEADDGTTISDPEYRDMLQQAGFEALDSTQIAYTFDAETVNGIVYNYPDDFELGDVATIDTGTVKAEAVISAVTEIYDSTGYSVFPTLELLAIRFILATEAWDDIIAENGNEIIT